jgi:hypothetical protein
VSGTANCKGNYSDWRTRTICWTCQYNECMGTCYYLITTTCCDCSTSGCGHQRCVATGDPATSWGMQPALEPVNSAPSYW